MAFEIILWTLAVEGLIGLYAVVRGHLVTPRTSVLGSHNRVRL